jgi:FkbM family methyltransferase
MRLPSRARGFVNRYTKQGVVERRNRLDDEHLTLLIHLALSADANCLDVGAHRGTVLAEIQRICPDGHHLAYEPLPVFAESLVQKFPTIEIRNKALSNKDGESTFVHVKDLPALSGLERRKYPREVETETIIVQTHRLDDHLPEGWLPSFIKVDVEGAEGLVFEGAMNTIRRAKPIIAFEHGPGGADNYGTGPADIFDLLTREAGLRIFDMDGNGPLSLADFSDPRGRFNWIAHA